MEIPTMIILLHILGALFVLGYTGGTGMNACGYGGICQCFKTGTKGFMVNCSRQNISAVPENIPYNVTKLDLSFNVLTTLPRDVFKMTVKLLSLNLANNVLEQLPNDVFGKIWYLESLNLANNVLEQLPNDVFGRSWYLEKLYLQDNHLKQIPRDLFVNMTKIEVLYLSNNFLKTVATDIFRSNQKIKTLSLSNNQLRELPEGVFGNILGLIRTNLSFNRLMTISEGTFKNNTKLEKVYLSHNSLNSIPRRLFSRNTEIHVIDISYNGLTNILRDTFTKNTKLVTLYLHQNNLSNIPDGIFASNNVLSILDLSSNSVAKLPGKLFSNSTNLGTVLMSNNQIEELPNGIFDNCRKLYCIDLSSNSVTHLPEKLFKSSTRLRNFLMSNNQIEELPKGIFDNCPKLYYIQLSNNTLKELPVDLLEKNLHLRRLDLSNNRLKYIIKEQPTGNENLNFLNLSRNELVNIQENSFVHYKGLTDLDLSRNPLQNLSKGLFASNHNLKLVYLYNTELQELPEDLLQNCSNLKVIGLSRNSLTELPRDFFKANQNLMVVFISRNNLKRIADDIFKGNPKLKLVSFSHNNLMEIPEDTFKYNAELTTLEISDNKLTNIPRNMFADKESLNKIDLTGNLLTGLTSGLFRSTTKLQSLRLCFNNIDGLPGNIFASMRGLTHLALCKNHLSIVHKTLLKGFENLIYLSLYDNRLPSLPEEFFKDVCLNGIVNLAGNEIEEIPSRLFDSNQTCSHQLTWLLLNNNKLVYLRKDSFKGLSKLTHVFLHGNSISTLHDGVFAGTMVRYVYLFSNNLTEISNKSFVDGFLHELQIYKNKIRTITADAFSTKSNSVHLYLECYDLTEIPLLNKNLTATCVTGGVLPKIEIRSLYSKAMMANLIENGFNCSFTEGIPECRPCPPGSYGNGLSGCQSCPAGGFYQDDVGRLVCKTCNNGTFVNYTGGKSNDDCSLCPEGTDLNRQAGRRACFCKMNYARTHRFQGCSLCLEEGLNCSQGFKSLQPGYYWNWSFPHANISEYSKFVLHLQNDSLDFNKTVEQYRFKIPKVHKCSQRLNCENRESFMARNIEGTCKDGYRGWLCSKCKTTYYSVLSTCLPCPSKIWVVLEVIAILCIGIGLYTVIIWQGKKQRESQKNERSIVDKISSQMKIVLGFYQVVGELFESLHDVIWVGPLAFVGEILSVLKINILRAVIRPHCFSEKLYINAKLQLIISISFPIGVLSVFIFVYHVWKFYLKYKHRFVSHDQVEKLQKLKEKLLTYAILLLFITYPPTCDVIFKLYPGACKTFYIYKNSTSVNITLLRSDFDLNCETLKTFQLLAYVATVVYVVSFPCVLLILLRKYCKIKITEVPNRENTDNYETITNSIVSERAYLINDNCGHAVIPVWINFLCENYKPQFWYWEIIELTRKVAQTVLVTLLGWEDALTKLLTIGTSVLFLTLHAKLSPMTSHFEQRLQMFSLMAIFINVLIASVPIPENYEAPLSTILIIMNMVIILVIAGEVVLYLIRCVKGRFKDKKET